MIRNVRYLAAICDGCERLYGTGFTEPESRHPVTGSMWNVSIEQAREEMKRYRWESKIVKGKVIDLCPQCQAKARVLKPRDEVAK